MNSCCMTPNFRPLFKIQDIYQTDLWKNEIRSIYRKNERIPSALSFFQMVFRSSSSFHPGAHQHFQLLSVPIPAAGAIFKNVTLVQQVIKNGISNDTATEKIIRGWNSFLQQQALIFQQSARTYSSPFKNELQQQLIRYLYRYQYRKHSENPPFYFLFRIPENTGKAHIYQRERKMNSSRRHPPNFFNIASIVKKQGNFFSFFRIPPSFFKICLLWKEAETAAGVQDHPIFRELNGLRGDMFLSEKLNFYFSLFPFWVSDRYLKKIVIRSSTCIAQYR